MGEKNKLSVVIDGKVYVIAGETTDANIQKIASYVDIKIRELKRQPGYTKLPKDYREILLSLNLAEEVFRLQDEVDILRQEHNENEKDVYLMKQDIVEKDMKIDTSSKLIAEYKSKLNELQKRIIELETRHGE